MGPSPALFTEAKMLAWPILPWMAALQQAIFPSDLSLACHKNPQSLQAKFRCFAAPVSCGFLVQFGINRAKCDNLSPALRS